jgi:glutamate racemase
LVRGATIYSYTMNAATSPIGVFDSGIGGLSILKALRLAMPVEHFVYFADSRHNPYGVKSAKFVRERSLSIVQTLLDEHQIKALVVACNTATAAAIELLRQTYPSLPIVGVEPSLKPAALATRTGRVRVLATRGTLQSEKFVQLKARLEAQYAAAQRPLHFDCVPCDGLAERIEQLSQSGNRWQNAPDLIAMCERLICGKGSFESEIHGLDTLVLGCTHYPLLHELFESLVASDISIMDNAFPVAQRTLQLIQHRRAPSQQGGGVIWRSSADESQLVQAARYWGVTQE